MPSISKASLRKARGRTLTTDKGLLRILLFAAGIVSLAIVVIPMKIENESLENLGRPVLEKVPPPLLRGEGNGVATAESAAGTHPKETHQADKQKHDDETKDTMGLSPSKETYSEIKVHKASTVVDVDASTGTSGKVKYHTVFSTGCSTFQDWQSYVFFYHLLHSGQEGPVTRIASGCKPKDAMVLQEIFDREIASMAPDRFRLVLTPEFSRIKPGITFKYFNKPCGMRHWMEEVLGFPDNHAEHDDTIFILLDPDQILIRPFTNDFTHSSEKWRLKDGYKLKVEHGSPFSQQYGYGIQWKRKVNPAQVFQGDSPVANMTDKEAFDYYMAMGPPYVATGKDMYTIVSTWADIVPRVHNDYPHLLAEMFGYNLAAAHHGLRHTIAHSFMVSDVFAGGEGWKLIDAVPGKDVCHHFPKSEYPHVIHYCQRYYLGKWFIGKYRLRKDFISCEAPLLTMPPEDLALKYNSSITPDHKQKDLQPRHVKEQAFMVCVMINALNEAAVYYKDHHCDKETANYDYTYTFHDNMLMPGETEE